MIAKSDTTDVDLLLQQAETAIQSRAREFCFHACPHDDMAQELRMAVFKSIDRFDETKSKWTTYVWNLTKFRAIDVIRVMGFKARLTGEQNKMRWAGSTDAPVVVDGKELKQIEPADFGDAIAEVDWADLCEHIEQNGTSAERARMLYLQGITMKQVGVRLGISESRVSQMLKSGDDLHLIAMRINHEFKRKINAPNPQPNGDPMKIFSTGKAAKIVGVCPRTLNKWIDTGKLEGFRIPGSLHRRVTRESLIKFLNSSGMPIPEALRPDKAESESAS